MARNTDSRRHDRHGHRNHHLRRSGPRPFTDEQLAARKAAVPRISYPAELPVSARREDIARAIKYSQVVIVAGETGSGKTTQLPKICLELGLGIDGLIGHTQPRRIAARSVAERISSELGVELGSAIGYQVRFTDAVSSTTLVKLMTDGILLAEIQSDPELRRYSAIIIDEAHERSLNIDFLLGYLAQLLPRRPDLKLIITSATIDSERFATHFGEHMYGGFPGNKAPIIEVSGRAYPVEVRYRPLWDGTVNDAERISAFDDSDNESLRPTSHDQTQGIVDAAHELCAEGPGDILVFLSGEGEIMDTLKAFKDDLREKFIEPGGRSSVPGAIEVLPLFARLSAAEQHRIFEPHQHRRIILATNIAETSLTVPGIHYVIDPGTARISRYSNKTKVQRLPIEAISQASANQRAGRSGRIANGIAIRLYSEDDFAARPEYTEPEIQRTSLASVILQMASLGLGSVEEFPFIDPPDMRAVRAGVQLLEEIGALTTASLASAPTNTPTSTQSTTSRAASHNAGIAINNNVTAHAGSPSHTPSSQASPQLTKIGRQLARLPIDPRLGRMLLAADRNGAAAEVLVLVAAMSVQDVRERPAEFKAQADQLHARFTEPNSDFLALLNIWRYLRTQQRELSGSAFRRLCRAEHINWLRFREWQDVVAQLRELAKPLGLHLRPIAIPTPQQLRTAEASMDAKNQDTTHNRAVIAAVKAAGKSSDAPASAAIHRSLMVGLLSNLGSWDERKRDYEGARGTHFVVWPGSGLHHKQYSWVMAAELVETSRLFARSVARIDPAWIEPIASHLVKRTYSEPYWSTKNGAAMVHERVTLYGLTITADRPVLASSIGTHEAQQLAREIFIRSALVEGQWRGGHHAFVKHNAQQLEQAHEIETRLRQYGLVADDAMQCQFFDERLPENIVSARHFDRWWKDERRRHPELLNFTQEFLLGESQGAAGSSDFPEEWVQGDIHLPITYTFNPGGHADGVTIDVPVTLLPQLREEGFDWLVPGMLPELVTATIRALPKRVRRNLVPAPDVARDLLARFAASAVDSSSADGSADASPSRNLTHVSFRDAFTQAVRDLRGIEIDDSAWDEADAALPLHLRVTFIVRSERGAVLDESTSLSALQHNLAPQSRSAVQNVMASAVSQALDEARQQIVNSERAAAQARARTNAQKARAAQATQMARTSAATLTDSVDNLRTWPALTDGTLPTDIETAGPDGMPVRGYPALVEIEDADAPHAVSIGLRVLTNQAEQRRDHRRGIIRLLANELALPEMRITTRWSTRESLALASSPYANTSTLVADLQLTAMRNLADHWAREHKQKLGTLNKQEQYEMLRDTARERLENEIYRLAQIATRTLEAWGELESTCRMYSQPAMSGTVGDVRAAVKHLVYDGFISATPEEYFADLPRFLAAATHRTQKAASNLDADDDLAWHIQEVEERFAAEKARAAAKPYSAERDAALTKARWMIEELRVSLFAQQLGTRMKVSAQRIYKLLNTLG